MALKANRPASNQPAPTQTGDSENTQAPTANVPAPVASQAVATAPRVSKNAVADMNAGILEGVEDLGGGNFVSVDGTDFLYKSRDNKTVDHIDIIVSYGKRFYQWVDESGESKVFNNSDTKLNDNYKLKFEIRWVEEEDEGEQTEFTHTLSTTGAMNFIEYAKKLAAAGYGVSQVITRLTISRQVSQDKQNRYSRVEMEAFDFEYNPLNIKTAAAKAIATA